MGILTGLSLFSGAGGLDLAAKRWGITVVGYVELDQYAQGVLMSRMRDGTLDPAPMWNDIKSFDGIPWRDKVDCVFGGFPCQDISTANYRATDIERGQRSGLWREFARIIRQVGPRFIVVENVPAIFIRGFGTVIGDLASLGYDAEWSVLSACRVGAPHMRRRMFLFAYSNGIRRRVLEENKKELSPRVNSLLCGSRWNYSNYLRIPMAWNGTRPSKGMLRMDDGLAEELDRIRLCGNGVVPQCAEIAFQKIIEMHEAQL